MHGGTAGDRVRRCLGPVPAKTLPPPTASSATCPRPVSSAGRRAEGTTVPLASPADDTGRRHKDRALATAMTVGWTGLASTLAAGRPVRHSPCRERVVPALSSYSPAPTSQQMAGCFRGKVPAGKRDGEPAGQMTRRDRDGRTPVRPGGCLHAARARRQDSHVAACGRGSVRGGALVPPVGTRRGRRDGQRRGHPRDGRGNRRAAAAGSGAVRHRGAPPWAWRPGAHRMVLCRGARLDR